jgi:KDO2-lipid IV(A) lauroyltransferase
VTARASRALARRAQVLVYLGGWRLLRLLPAALVYGAADRVADVGWRRRGAPVRRLEANLARGRPDLDPAALHALVRAGLRSYLRYWCDVFRLPSWTPEQVVEGIRVVGDEPVRASLASGRGVVAALAHQGNWDHAGAWATLRLAPVTTVAEQLEPREVFAAFQAFRTRLGMEILPLGDPAVTPTLVRRLRDGALVPLLADRDLSGTGVEVSLCGHPARMAAGPASLADVTRAALHPVSIWYEPATGPASGWRTVIEWHPEVPRPELARRADRVAAMTQVCADALGAGIAAHPQDWHMLQPVFGADLPPGRSAASR